MRDSLGFNILLVLAARFNDLYSDFVGAQGIFFPKIYLNDEEIKSLVHSSTGKIAKILEL